MYCVIQPESANVAEPLLIKMNLSLIFKFSVLVNEAVPATDKSPVIVALPFTVNNEPSNVKLDSPLIEPVPVAVNK